MGSVRTNWKGGFFFLRASARRIRLKADVAVNSEWRVAMCGDASPPERQRKEDRNLHETQSDSHIKICEVAVVMWEVNNTQGEVVLRCIFPFRVAEGLKRGSILINICVQHHPRTMEIGL